MVLKSSKKQKKLWFNLVTPKEFGNYSIGETTAFDAQKLVGRNVKVSLMNLLNDPRKQNVQLKFKIKNVRDKSAVTEIISYGLQPAFIKRLVRKGRNKVEFSFVSETKDKVKIRIKPLMITRSKSQRAKLSDLKKKAHAMIDAKVKASNLSEFINEAISTKIQKEIKHKLKKICPLTVCEFRIITRI